MFVVVCAEVWSFVLQGMVIGLRDLPGCLLQQICELLDGKHRYLLFSSCSEISSRSELLLEASNNVLREQLVRFNHVIGAIANVLQRVSGRGWFRTVGMQHVLDEDGIWRLCIQLHTFSSERLDDWHVYALANRGVAHGMGSGDGRITEVLAEGRSLSVEISQAIDGVSTIRARQSFRHRRGQNHWAELWSVQLDKRVPTGNGGQEGWAVQIEICPSCGINNKFMHVVQDCAQILMEPLYVGGWYEIKWARVDRLRTGWVRRCRDGVFVLIGAGRISLDILSCTESVHLRSLVAADEDGLPEFELKAVVSSSDICPWW